jgi:pimeloyl-ACP methyl ester carboxylesterase
MASDAVGVLDALAIDRAHIVGASMGGMISQRIAIDHPHRVLSLTSIMSTTGNPVVGAPTPEAMAVLFTPPPAEREAYLDQSVVSGRVISGPLFDAEKSRARAEIAYDRCFNPAGAAFQIAAIMDDGDRTEALAALDVPALVIHGSADTLVTLSGGEATAAAIPGAELLVLDEMGHDLPEPLWPEIADAIARVASAASVA